MLMNRFNKIKFLLLLILLLSPVLNLAADNEVTITKINTDITGKTRRGDNLAGVSFATRGFSSAFSAIKTPTMHRMTKESIGQKRQMKMREDAMREKLFHLPAKQGLYDPALEKDSCGVGFIAHIKGTPSGISSKFSHD